MKFWLHTDTEAIPQGRPRVTCRGKFPRVYDPPRSAAYKATMRALLQIEARKQSWPVTEEPVWVRIYCQFRGKPRVDVDNLAKGILDSAKGILWKDDVQVLGLTVIKANNLPSYTSFEVSLAPNVGGIESFAPAGSATPARSTTSGRRTRATTRKGSRRGSARKTATR
jgi:Holliday junction resolvase RusA-like endonuclease